MINIPRFRGICELSREIPAAIGEFLNIESITGRRVREETASDILISAIAEIPGNNIVLNLPRESITGSDFDIAVLDPSTKEGIQFRIQAKRLIPNVNRWDWGTYRELSHPDGTGHQVQKLIRSSAAEKILTIPMYIFYNPSFVCVQSNHKLKGITVVDGFVINAIVRAIKAARPGKPKYKQVRFLQPYMFDLSDIFCIPSGESRNFGNRDIRTPVATRDVVVQRIYRSMENLRGFVGGRRFDPPRGLSRREELFSLEWLTEREPMLDSGRASRRIAPFESSVSTRRIREGRRLTSGLEVENWPSRFVRALMNREQKII